jgi:hypothetical protein
MDGPRQRTGELVEFPVTTVPEPTGEPYLDKIELTIIRRGVSHVQGTESVDTLYGLALARDLYLRTRADLSREPDPRRYVAGVLRAVRRLSPKDQTKLLHPALDRARAQTLLREENR